MAWGKSVTLGNHMVYILQQLSFLHSHPLGGGERRGHPHCLPWYPRSSTLVWKLEAGCVHAQPTLCHSPHSCCLASFTSLIYLYTYVSPIADKPWEDRGGVSFFSLWAPNAEFCPWKPLGRHLPNSYNFFFFLKSCILVLLISPYSLDKSDYI